MKKVLLLSVLIAFSGITQPNNDKKNQAIPFTPHRIRFPQKSIWQRLREDSTIKRSAISGVGYALMLSALRAIVRK